MPMGKNQEKKRRGRPPQYDQPPNRGAQRLARAISKAGDTQAAAAERIGCSVPYLNNLIHGRKMPSRIMAAKLKDTCKIPVESWDQPAI